MDNYENFDAHSARALVGGTEVKLVHSIMKLVHDAAVRKERHLKWHSMLSEFVREELVRRGFKLRMFASSGHDEGWVIEW